MIRIVAIGECMVELTRNGANTLKLGFAGDTCNTAVYLSRLGGGDFEVRYLTAVGDDALSGEMLSFLHAERLEVDAQRVAGASPALYIVTTDTNGERSFTYYRDASPVRHLFDSPVDADLVAGLRGAGLVYFSAITLQQLTPHGRQTMLTLVREAREQGARVAFDSNYRPRGWPSVEVARNAISAAMRLCDIALPSRADEELLTGPGTVDEIIARYRSAGASEIVVKDGAESVTVWADGSHQVFPTKPNPQPVDTTGAGDSFNAGYLAARVRRAPVVDAVRAGQELASLVIMERGALISRASS